MNITEIIRKYSAGELTLEEANSELKAGSSSLYLDPCKNVITEEEKAATVVSDDPAKVTGWGLLDVSIGGMEKVHIENGKFADDLGDTGYPFYIGGKVFRVMHDHLIPMEDK